MRGRIPEDFIDQVLAATDIVDVVGQYVSLKKAGRDFSGLCPFHSEKSPSFTVSPIKQFYHCFGCGAHGSAIRFLMEHDNLPFAEAVEELASRASMELPTSAQATAEPHTDLLDAMTSAAGVYYRHLRDLRADDAARRYLQQRGIDDAVAQRFGIGFAPEQWDFLLKALRQHPRAVLEKAGLTSQNDSGRVYDRFRNRLMFPIRDRKGRVIAFGGRVLGNDTPKYLNSPETPIFHKGTTLYGLHEMLEADARPEFVIVTEGYMDVVSLSQFGINNAVATLGTATTTEHGKRLARLTRSIVFCFDGDRAGRAAAWRAMENMLPLARPGLSIRCLLLPDNEDPDSLVRREGAEAFLARCRQATALPEFVLDELTSRVELSTVDGRAELINTTQALMAKLPDGVYRTVLADALSKRVNIQPERLSSAPQPPPPAAEPQRPSRPAAPPAKNEIRRTPVRVALALLIQRPDVLEKLDSTHTLEQLDEPGAEVLAAVADFIRQRPQVTTARILEHWHGHAWEKSLAKLAAWEHLVPEHGQPQEFVDTIHRLRARSQTNRLELLQSKLEATGLNAEEMLEYRNLLSARRAS